MRAALKSFSEKAPGWMALLIFLFSFLPQQARMAAAAPSVDYPVAKLRSLDKISARTTVFEAEVGSTLKFGEVYIKVQACRKAPEMEQPESAAFLQIWEVAPKGDADGESRWIFSGWMFASSPGLSSMDHPIYDVWVLDCLGAKGEAEDQEGKKQGEGEMPHSDAPMQPDIEIEPLGD